MAMAEQRNDKPGRTPAAPRERTGWLSRIAPGVRNAFAKRETPERAAAIARVADAAVVGSALVDEIAEAVQMNEDVTVRVLSKVNSLAKAVRFARVGQTTV